MTDLLKRIEKIYQRNGIPCEMKETPSQWYGSEYFGIYKSCKGKSRGYMAYAAHFPSLKILEVRVPRDTTPEQIMKQFGIECTGDPEDKVDSSPDFYVVRISLENNLLNGRYTVEEKEPFFVHMANRRLGRCEPCVKPPSLMGRLGKWIRPSR